MNLSTARLRKRASSGLAALKQVHRYVPQNTLIYKSLIEPLFDYCDVFGGKLNKTLTTRLQTTKSSGLNYNSQGLLC